MNMLFWQNVAATWRHVEENVQTSAINWSAHTTITETAIEQGNHLINHFENFSFDDIEDI